MAATRIVIRADSGAHMGSGHVMRTLALAQELRRRGAEVRFVCREHPGHSIARLERLGYDVARLAAPPGRDLRVEDYGLWLGVSQDVDARETLSVLGGERCDWLIVDHYSLDCSWETRLRSVARRILVVDDLANRRHECEALLDQSFLGESTSTRYDALLPDSCSRLLGPAYALLAAEYRALRPLCPPRDGNVQRVLLNFGGGDQSADFLRVIEALEFPAFARWALDVVVNSASAAAVQDRAARRALTTVHCGLASLAGLMARADLAVGAGGGSTWERACLGLPALVATIAANQRPMSAALHAAGYQRLVGDASALDAMAWCVALQEMTSVPARLRDIAQRAATLTDGTGCEKVADLMLGSGVRKSS